MKNTHQYDKIIIVFGKQTHISDTIAGLQFGVGNAGQIYDFLIGKFYDRIPVGINRLVFFIF
jgi:hypothetical protein